MPLKHCLEGVYWLSDFADRWSTIRSDREALKAKQLAKFRRLVHYAHRHSPYYAALIERYGIDPATCTDRDLPVLTKQEVIDHFDEIVTDRRITREKIELFLRKSSDPTELFKDDLYIVHTSGSSGRIGYFVYSSREWIRGCSHQIRFLGRLGIRTRTAFVAATTGHYTGVSLTMTGQRRINRLFFRPRPFDVNQPTANIVDGLNQFQPRVLLGYGATLYMLAVEQAEGRLRIHPRRVISSGEPLLGESRAFIEATFGVPVANVYASSEHLFMGIGRTANNEMYLLEDDLIFECHDDHTCVTNLFNWTMPLIRYRMDDVLIPSGHRSADHPFQIVNNIVGRTERPIVLKNHHGREDFIHPLVITELVAAHLLAFQMRILSNTSFVLRAQLEPGVSEQQRARAHGEITRGLKKILAAKDMDRSVAFNIEEVDKFEVEKDSGKFRLIETDRTYESLGGSSHYRVA